jgi:CRP-like cAMP-binding protein
MLFSDLPEAAFDETLQPVDHFIFHPDAVLYEAGSKDSSIYSIRQGLVKLLNVVPDGSQRIVRLLGPGSVVGLEILGGSDAAYRHTAIAVNDVDACRIPAATVTALESRYPQLCDQVRRRFQSHIDLADQWITALGTGPARERVAHLLLMLTEFTLDPNGDIELIGREDMAAMVGTSVETVSRVVAELKRRGQLYKVAANLYRCDKNALQQITGQSQW